MGARDAAERCGPADAVLTEAARGVAARVEAGNHLAVQVDDLGAGVDPYARIGVVKRWRVPRRIERRLGDLVHRPRLLEIGIDAGVDEGIVAFHGFAQGRPGHRPPLGPLSDPPRQFLVRSRPSTITGAVPPAPPYPP